MIRNSHLVCISFYTLVAFPTELASTFCKDVPMETFHIERSKFEHLSYRVRKFERLFLEKQDQKIRRPQRTSFDSVEACNAARTRGKESRSRSRQRLVSRRCRRIDATKIFAETGNLAGDRDSFVNSLPLVSNFRRG